MSASDAGQADVSVECSSGRLGDRNKEWWTAQGGWGETSKECWTNKHIPNDEEEKIVNIIPKKTLLGTIDQSITALFQHRRPRISG